MSKYKAIITGTKDTYGMLDIVDNMVSLSTSGVPQLFYSDVDEEYFSKFRTEGEGAKPFNFVRDTPENWRLVDVRISVVDKNNDDEISNFVKNYIENLEEWEELSESESKNINSVIEADEASPFDTRNSFHVWEERYKIDGDTIRLIGAIGQDGHSIERLKN